ncbi:MAG: bifunctional adenosylcobinamide kinase/adenosylcobinamide-phosphate guanylyltransferase [Pseudazoarcus pumilus]|nr:bifunctional adenosylcobinamide kinase/adenosylcobinamide-phosphate guanylyltransferase [Pseudazoarcus pumilus]
MSSHLILGGARSGKSRHAERQALAHGGEVSVIVTAEALDDEMAERIRRHQADRPAEWHTVEAPLALADALQREAAEDRVVIVDCLTLWLANLLGDATQQHEPTLLRERTAVLDLLPTLPGTVLLVANETGLGLVPETPLGRRFRDEAGWLNQAVAQRCDKVTFIAAGLPLVLKG